MNATQPSTTNICDQISLSLTSYLYVAVCMLYAVPTFFLYCSIITMIYKKNSTSNFKSPFYKLFIFNSVLCMGGFLADFIVNRFLAMGIWCSTMEPIFKYYDEDRKVVYADGSLITAQFHFLSYYFLHGVLISATFLSLNRLTAVLFPMDNTRIWHYLLPLSYACSLLIPLVCLWHLCISPAYFVLMLDITDGTYSLGLNYIKTVKWIKNSQLGAIVATVTGGFKLLFTVITLVAMRQHKDKLTKKSTAERDLFFVGVSMAIAAEMYSIVQMLLFYSNLHLDELDALFNLMFRIRPYVTDLVVISPPWLLLLIGTTVRENIFKMLKKWDFREDSSIPEVRTVTVTAWQPKQRTKLVA